MPRASEYLLEGYTYHLTHRCHNRQFLMQFGRDRNVYREWLREGVRRHGVPVYAYCITRNHIHIVAHVDSAEKTSALMHLAAGSTAKHYNVRKDREGSMWQHPYQCTVIQDGQHLLNCLCYVDLNMVRARVVSHPKEWRWCGYDELVGARRRYRVLHVDHLAERFDFKGVKEFGKFYEDAIERRLEQKRIVREAHWTEALAVGSREFVEDTKNKYSRRWCFEFAELAGASHGAWMVKETHTPYEVVSPQEKGG